MGLNYVPVQKREVKKVKSKNKTYSYGYRISVTDEGKVIRIRQSNKGYQENWQLTKLQKKNGKLTKMGEAFLEQLKNDPNTARGRALVKEFEAYRKTSINQKDFLTIERWNSHMITNRLERFIFNLGSTPEEVLQQINITAQTDYTIGELYNMDWNFKNNTITYDGKQWSVDFDYQAYNGFRIRYLGELKDGNN